MVKTNEREKQQNPFPMKPMEEPKCSSEIEGNKKQGAFMGNLPMCEVPVETNEAE